MILGIDPSYTQTGVALYDGKYRTYKFNHKGTCYADIVTNHNACDELFQEILSVIPENSVVDVVIEYPAFATKSGAYLAIMNGYLNASLRMDSRVNSIVLVPPTACDSYTKNKQHSKTYLVDWCKKNNFISKRVTHDECTAIILIELLKAIRLKKYKNSYFVWQRKATN